MGEASQCRWVSAAELRSTEGGGALQLDCADRFQPSRKVSAVGAK
jgi:hypothetical protein